MEGVREGERGRSREGGWTKVTNRRDRYRQALEVQRLTRWDIVGRLEDRMRGSTTSFYFTEFPDNFGAREMYQIFAKYGEIKEVVIPPKRNKMGKRYGFARFLNIQDFRKFAIRLDNIIIGRRKIFVNIPRFHRSIIEKVKADEGRDQMNFQTRAWTREETVPAKENFVRGISFADKVKGKYVPEELPVFTVKEETMRDMESTHVGVVRNAGESYMIQRDLYNEGIFSIKAIPMGANMVLLVDKEKGAYKGVIAEFKEWFDRKFVKLSRWNQLMLDKERICWIRCFGIPPQAWTSEFFEFVSRFVGNFLEASPNTVSWETLDAASLKITTSQQGLINLNVDVLINEVLFTIRIVEIVNFSEGMDGVETQLSTEIASSDDESIVPETDEVWQEGMFEFLRDDLEEEEAETSPTAQSSDCDLKQSFGGDREVHKAEVFSGCNPDEMVVPLGGATVSDSDGGREDHPVRGEKVNMIPEKKHSLNTPMELNGIDPVNGGVPFIVDLTGKMVVGMGQTTSVEIPLALVTTTIPVSDANQITTSEVSGTLSKCDLEPVLETADDTRNKNSVDNYITVRPARPQQRAKNRTRKLFCLSDRMQDWESPLGRPSKYSMSIFDANQITTFGQM